MAVREIRHPLIRHKLGLLRDNGTSTRAFRELAAEIAAMLTCEATADLALEQVDVHGWSGPLRVERLAGRGLTVVPILRAGVGMLDGVLRLLPGVPISAVGIARDEATLRPHTYLAKLAPQIETRMALIVDPMLATGGSLIATIELLKQAGCREIRALVLVAAPEGIRAVEAAHPEVDIFCAAVDQCLNAQGYIIPGLGDAGDRLFGTCAD